MAIRYLYPIPDPIKVLPEVPRGFTLTEEVIANLPVTDLDQAIRDLAGHQIFNRPKGQDQWDAILLALDDRRRRREDRPDEPDYLALPGEAAKILKICVDDPMFFQLVDDPSNGGQSPAWVRGYPWAPHASRAFRPFLECLRNPKDKPPG